MPAARHLMDTGIEREDLLLTGRRFREVYSGRPQWTDRNAAAGWMGDPPAPRPDRRVGWGDSASV